MNNRVVGILAHVDAGKTTLAEAILYKTGVIRKPGRVDSGSAALDSHELERERGITIFSSQGEFRVGESGFTLLDTPGHADFTAETERTLRVLDCAILVISGIDGVQAHTRTLWRLLGRYDIPVFIFVSKMDFARRSREDILSELQDMLSPYCTAFDRPAGERDEALAMCSEEALERYMNGTLSDGSITDMIRRRETFPCVFGSGLRFDGVDTLLEVMEKYAPAPCYPDEFGARAYKISYDEKGARLTHIKVTGGVLKVRGMLGDEKINQIRIYNGAKYVTAEELPAGGICAVTGPERTKCWDGFGNESGADRHIVEPVMRYSVKLPDGCDPKTVMPGLRRFEEEDPLLRIGWDPFLREINAALMGEMQVEILKSLIKQRIGIDVEIGCGRVLYKETIASPARGAGHFEPLRHYAEVHLLLSPLKRGEGLIFDSVCSEDELDRNWQRLIMTNLAEKTHLGVLTGSPITDMRITLTAGRAHLKHTEGGDFRQATYRAVRHGLMHAQSVLLEPYYRFTLEVSADKIGRAINDIRMMSGEFELGGETGSLSLLTGSAPVSTMNGYAADVRAYTGGLGSLVCETDGYRECHNTEEVIEAIGYDAERDTENTADSVFCSHGAGHSVGWRESAEHMHIKD